MADITSAAFAIIFIGVLLLVGALIFGTIADPMGDQWYGNETLGITIATCSDPYDPTLCSAAVANPPIENVTRAVPIVYNCTAAKTNCQIMTAKTHYNVTTSTGVIYVNDDDYNGSIFVNYWSDTASATADRAQQSITSTAYGGFDLATVMVIVMAAVAIVGAIFLIGKPGA